MDELLCPDCGTRHENAKPGTACTRCGSLLHSAAQIAETLPFTPAVPVRRVSGPQLEPGTVLGRCRIVRELGRGGMGAVYLAEHTTLNIPVAVKILIPPPGADAAEFADRFLREARLAARIRHPSAMAVMDAVHDEPSGLDLIVLEYVDGGSVRQKLEAGPLPLPEAVGIALGVAHALVAAAEHAIIHRDIKPDNIMLTARGEVKLADLGLAKTLHETDGRVTISSAIMGTPAYMSPEQAEDTRSVDARTDLYSLGATLYHMLAGEPPFQGENAFAILKRLATEPTPDPRTRRPDLPESIAAVCRKLMAKAREDRYASAAEAVRDLEAVRAGAVSASGLLAAPFAAPIPGAMPVSCGPVVRLSRALGLPPAALVAIPATAALLLGGLLVLLLLASRPSARPRPEPASPVVAQPVVAQKPASLETPRNAEPAPARPEPAAPKPAPAIAAGPAPVAPMPVRETPKTATPAAKATEAAPEIKAPLAETQPPKPAAKPPVATPAVKPAAAPIASPAEKPAAKPVATPVVKPASVPPPAAPATPPVRPSASAVPAVPAAQPSTPPSPEKKPQPRIAPESAPPADPTPPTPEAPEVPTHEETKRKKGFALMNPAERPGASASKPAVSAPPAPPRPAPPSARQSIPDADIAFELAEKTRKDRLSLDWQKNYRKAEELYRRVITRWPDSDKVEASHIRLGEIYESEWIGHYDKALAEYKAVMQLNPASAFDPEFRIAELYDDHLDDPAEAKRWYERAARDARDDGRRKEAGKKAEKLRKKGF